MSLNDFKKGLIKPSNTCVTMTKCYLGEQISSFIFNSQLSSKLFNKIEDKLKKKCELDEVPYQLFNEYNYQNYIYNTNSKYDSMITMIPINSKYITGKKCAVKITQYNQTNIDTYQFNSQFKYDNIQPFLQGSLKINDNIVIKLRKNLYSYDKNSDVKSYQIYIEIKWDDIKSSYITLATKILHDITI